MSPAEHYLAFDYGAESGRALLGALEGGRLRVEELHRFANVPCKIGDRLCWDILSLYRELKFGLAKASADPARRPRSLGVDSWGVDFGLLDGRGDLLGNPVHYRDARTEGIFERAFDIVPKFELYARTGIQFLRFNSLFQLLSMRLEDSPILAAADRLLMIPDLFNFWLTGEAAQEFTNATTTQCMGPARADWEWTLLDQFQIPRKLFGEVAAPGTRLGAVRADVAAETGCGNLPVILPATHDTGSAVLGVPAQSGAWAFISCGTWSLVGAETPAPIINEQALAANFTNEGGAFGTNRLLSNVMGLWLLQQSRKSWERRGVAAEYDRILAEAETAPAFAALVDPDDDSFMNPPDMVEAIANFCRRTGQAPPESVGAVARCIFESLAMKYRMKIEQLAALAGRRAEVIHIVGGGSRNAALCQATADACARPVLAGPAEATAIGNLLVQAVGAGRLGGLDDIRAVVRASSELREFAPRNPAAWDAPYERFRSLCA